MKVRVPKLNPLVFTNSSGEYNVYDDAALKEQLFPYVQPYASTDRITFQVQWDEVPIAQAVTMRIELKTSADVSTSFYRDYTFTGITSGGDNYTNYYKVNHDLLINTLIKPITANPVPIIAAVCSGENTTPKAVATPTKPFQVDC